MRINFLIILVTLFACKADGIKPNDQLSKSNDDRHTIIQTDGSNILSRYLPLPHCVRVKAKAEAFATYLRNIKLKQDGAKVLYYDGSEKTNNQIYAGVFDMNIGNKNLHQCADAIMRLQAEYLWNQGRFDQIKFNFTNGFEVAYSEWMKGRRMVIEGNKTYWNDSARPSNTYKDFWSYMELIFMYAGTASFTKELKSVPFEQMEIGDVLIQGGSPGHAIMVIDMAMDTLTQEKYYMVGQSYMPAQDFQVLHNKSNPEISPWYPLKTIDPIRTPEWIFEKSDLKRFPVL